MIASAKIAGVLGGAAVLHEPITGPGDLEAAVRRHLPMSVLDALIASNRLSLAEVKALIVPSSTYARRAKEGVLNGPESERTERLARIIATAEEVFLDPGKAGRFLRGPHPELGGRTPLAVAASELGARQVEVLLWQTAHGIPA